MQRLLLTVLIVGFFLPWIGCGEKNHGTVPVSITITQKGSPLAGATVTIISSDGKGHSAGGRTDSSGTASLQTPERWKGALPGEYVVAVKKWVGETVPDPTDDSPDATRTDQKNVLPAKYGEHTSSGFQLTVGNKASHATFDIGEE